MTDKIANLLAELEQPGVICADSVCAGVLQFLVDTGCLAEQVARWQRLVRVAEIAAADSGARAALGIVDQKVRALQRQAVELDRLLQEVVATIRELGTAADSVRAAIGNV